MQKTKSTFFVFALTLVTAFGTTISLWGTDITTQPQKVKRAKSHKVISTPPPTQGSRGSATTLVVAPELWSNPATWGGVKPVAGAAVTIAAGKHIILDENTPALAGLTINGTLEFDRKNVSLTAHWIMLMGTMYVGSAASPFTHQATITLNGTDVNQNIMGMGTRGLMVMGGTLELHGTPPTKTWTKINAHAPQGSTNLSLLESVNWKVNDQIVVAPTDYPSTGVAQKMSINAISGTSLTTSVGMNAQRWGLLQYATASGMSLTYSPPPATVVAGTPIVLDERAEVGNLTRNIVIQAPDDARWQNDKFGCHVMIMRQGTTQGIAHVNGVEIRRGGQNGKIGRYPFHWHMLSYEGSTTLADATGQYIRNSSVHESVHRGIVIHGTNGVEVSKNVLFNIRGHAVFTEDASERRNTIDGNLVMHVRSPTTPLKVHETDLSKNSAGFWVSNPDNTITNNTAADCIGSGYWFAFTTQAWGLSAGISMNPSRTLFGVFDNNTAHSNSGDGILFDDVESDNDGNTMGFKYVSTTDGLEPEWPFPNRRRHMLSRYTTWKNAGRGIWNRATIPDNDQVVSADNCSKFFSGAGDDGLIKRSLAVGNSLNYNMNGVTRPEIYGSDPPVALASYHSSFNIKDNFILNFPPVPNTSSGAFALDDYYLIAVDKGLVRNVNNTLVNSHPGVRILPWEPQFTFATLWDPHDYWGGSPSQDNYYVFNNPFFTYGQTPTVVQPNTTTSGGVVVVGPFYGVQEFVINKANSPWSPYMEIQVKRLNSSLATIGTWAVAEGVEGQLLPNMRHFATHPTGIYELDFPTINNVHDISIRLTNMLTTNDYQVIGMEYNGAYQINGLFASTAWNLGEFGGSVPMPTVNDADTHIYTPVANLAAVRNAPTGEVFWQDRVNNKVWFKVRGGLNEGDPNEPTTTDYNLYKAFNIRAFGTSAPLAVELLDFKSKNTEGGNLLTWTTASEKNNAGFDIEASADGVRFEKIGFVKGNSTTNFKHTYDFLDKTPPLSNLTYYRLQQIDFDGTKKVSATISIQKNTTSKGLKVYPNPTAQSEISVEWSNYTEGGIEVVNAIGQTVFQHKFTPLTGERLLRIEISSWSSGVYFIKSGQEMVKFVKN
jgi:G8 domain/Right handed beta helix region/Secretion system C-terminal sorting domain